MEFWDDNDNRVISEPVNFSIDTVVPEVSIDKPEGIDLIFSPDGDGNKDSLTIHQSGSSEKLWEGAIVDLGGSTVKTYTWENEAPETVAWDGKDASGGIVPDGVYSYVIRSTDQAGNSVEESLVDILINTEKPPVSLTIDNSFISPGNKQGTDSIRFGTGIPVTTGILEWEVRVLDAKGTPYWTYNSRQQGILEVPDAIPYDGSLSSGGFLAEGKYQGYMTVRYQNGYKPEVYSPWFTVDKTAPRGTVSGNSLLTLNEAGDKYSLTLNLDTTEEDYWEGFIRNIRNEIVKSYFWRGKADPQVIWSGRDNQGKPVPDGEYTLVLEAMDKAGNRGVSRPHSITLDTREMSVKISVSDDAFSPDGNGVKDQVTLYSIIDDPEGIEQWTLSILPVQPDIAAATPVKIWTGTKAPTAQVKWNGKSDDGSVAPDGLYVAELSALYTKGNKPTARSSEFVKDTLRPEIQVTVGDTLFSPDGDGNKDSVSFIQSSSLETEFTGKIADAKGTLVKTLYWTGKTANFTWDGRDENGNMVPDGVYSYRVMSTDLAGNTTEAVIPEIEVDTKPTAVYLTAKIPFSLRFQKSSPCRSLRLM